MNHELDSAQSFVHLLRDQVRRFPDRPAITCLRDGEAEAARFTYAALDARARAIAASLQQAGLAGERVLLVYPPGPEYVCAFLGCLYAGATAVPIYPPRTSGRESNLDRVRAVAADTRSRVALTERALLEAMPSFEAVAQEALAGARLLATDTIPEGDAERWELPAVGRHTLAFLQYTSGSTSAPKGVMVSHGNILANQEMIGAAMALPQGFCVVGWLPLFHDMGLIGNLLGPLCRGGHAVLMSPIAFLQRPARWLQAISRYRPYISGGPNFGYALCARKVTDRQKESLDLSSWRVAFNGAERVQAGTLEAFAAAFAGCGFRREAFLPCYGLAEATLLVSGGPADGGARVKQVVRAELEAGRVSAATEPGAAATPLVACGVVQQETRLVDPETRTEVPPGQVGEIWTRGPNNAGGYWNRPELSREVFAARLADGTEGEYLRTGDLGFVDGGGPEAQLYIVGRLKDLVIVDGRNLYPEDVERTVEGAHPEVRAGCCAAFSVLHDGAELLVVVAELEGSRVRAAVEQGRARDQVLAELTKGIRATVSAAHEARVHDVALVTPGGVPKTSSGKLQRAACRAAFLANSLPRLGSENA
jgi:acyl-CoA synthetase (AMP-forming)/AMP-acid ligase II